MNDDPVVDDETLVPYVCRNASISLVYITNRPERYERHHVSNSVTVQFCDWNLFWSKIIIVQALGMQYFCWWWTIW